MENPIKMDDLGVPLFSETSTSSNCQISINFHCHDWCSRTCTFAGKTGQELLQCQLHSNFCTASQHQLILAGSTMPYLTFRVLGMFDKTQRRTTTANNNLLPYNLWQKVATWTWCRFLLVYSKRGLFAFSLVSQGHYLSLHKTLMLGCSPSLLVSSGGNPWYISVLKNS